MKTPFTPSSLLTRVGLTSSVLYVDLIIKNRLETPALKFYILAKEATQPLIIVALK